MKLVSILLYCVSMQVQFLASFVYSVSTNQPLPEMSDWSITFRSSGQSICGYDALIIGTALEGVFVCAIYLLSRIPGRQPNPSLDSQI